MLLIDNLYNSFFLPVNLQVLYKLKTAKIFEKPKKESQDDDPFAVYLIHLCPESRMLCMAGASHLILFKFSKLEVSTEITVSSTKKRTFDCFTLVYFFLNVLVFMGFFVWANSKL